MLTLQWEAIALFWGRKVTRSEFYVKRIALAAMLELDRDGTRVESGGPTAGTQARSG